MGEYKPLFGRPSKEAPNWQYESGDDQSLMIDDIMAVVKRGGRVVFQRNGDQVEVRKIPHLSASGVFPLFPLWEPGDIETLGCYWKQGEPIQDGEVMKQWELHKSEEPCGILIWWDHDLGDVVVDACPLKEAEEQVESDGSFRQIVKNVYFYWIT